MLKLLRDAADAVGKFALMDLVGEDILDAGEPALDHEVVVVGRIVRHHDRGRRIEAFDEHPDLVVNREIHGAANASEVPASKKVARVIEERAGDMGIRNRFKEAEEADPVVMEVVVSAVDDGANTAQNFTVGFASGEERFNLAVLVERIFGSKSGFDVDQERGYPRRISGLNLPGEEQKILPVPGGANR